MQIHELVDEMTSIADAGNYLAVDNGVITQKIDYLRLAKAIIEVYNGSSINGSNQTLQAAIAELQDEIDDTLVSASTLSDLYSQVVALPLTKPVFFQCAGGVSSSLTSGDVTSILKGLITKMDAEQNICDIIASDGSGYIHMIRNRFASASEVLVQIHKSTKDFDALSAKLTPQNVASTITLTNGTNCGAVTLQAAYKYGNVLFIKFSVTPSANISAGGSVDVGISGCTPIMGGDFRLLYGVIGTVMFTSWMANNTTIRCRRMASDAWTTSLSPIISGIILCSD